MLIDPSTGMMTDVTGKTFRSGVIDVTGQKPSFKVGGEPLSLPLPDLSPGAFNFRTNLFRADRPKYSNIKPWENLRTADKGNLVPLRTWVEKPDGLSDWSPIISLEAKTTSKKWEEFPFVDQNGNQIGDPHTMLPKGKTGKSKTHFYVLEAQYPYGMNLARDADNIKAGGEPTLRPFVHGGADHVELGEQVGIGKHGGEEFPVFKSAKFGNKHFAALAAIAAGGMVGFQTLMPVGRRRLLKD